MNTLPQTIRVADKHTPVIQYKSVPVMTTAQLAELYGTDQNNVQVNFNRNTDRFVEGKHYFKLEGDDLKVFKNIPTVSKYVPKQSARLILWTEKGAARHAKILDTDQAWDIFEQLEEVYFSVKEKSHLPALPNFADPAAAARAWAEQFEAKQLAQQQVAELAPKAEALDTIADTTNTYCLRNCAKTIGIKESELIQLLIDKKWIYREPSKTPGKSGKLQPHAQYVTNKVFINRISPVITNQYTGQEMVHTNMRVTAFGLTRITGLVNKNRKVAA